MKNHYKYEVKKFKSGSTDEEITNWINSFTDTNKFWGETCVEVVSSSLSDNGEIAVFIRYWVIVGN